MKCYYEELGIDRDANDADIKTAYRKLALRWHPDKNPDCSEEAKERFQLIQQAYEVLSDAHERAWYDNHREQILRGKNSDYEDICLDLFQYFTVSCFKGYGDDKKGFYATYREVFVKLAVEDAEFLDDDEEISCIPKFGDSHSNYEEVVGPFYAYWQSYCTRKTYAWLCPYDIKEIKDRRVLREIEKEMKKIVLKAKKERNEEVRNLVSFIRKRDKRVIAYRQQLEQRAQLNRQKQEQNRRDQILKRQQELEAMRTSGNDAFGEGYEEQLKLLEQEYGCDSSDEEDSNELDDTVESETEEDYIDDLYCIACNKSFTNKKAFTNHATSKKHRENVDRMTLDMQAEEEAFGESETEEFVIVSSEADDTESAELVIEAHEIDELVSDVEKIQLNGENETNSLSLEEDETLTPNLSKNQRKGKKSKKGNRASNVPLADTSEHEQDEHDGIAEASRNTIQNTDDEDWRNFGKKGAKKNKTKNKKQPKKTVESQADKETVPPECLVPDKLPIEVDELAAPMHICVTCKANFDSKNKLFAHLKKTNHGVYIPKVKTEPLDINPKKAKGRRK